jgi:hypothetical protein
MLQLPASQQSEKFGLRYHVYYANKEKKEEGKGEKRKEFRVFEMLDLSFTLLLSTSLSMRPGIATDTFLWLFLGNVHPPGSNRKDSAPKD